MAQRDTHKHRMCVHTYSHTTLMQYQIVLANHMYLGVRKGLFILRSMSSLCGTKNTLVFPLYVPHVLKVIVHVRRHSHCSFYVLVNLVCLTLFPLPHPPSPLFMCVEALICMCDV